MPQCQRRRNEPVHASVVRHLQHVDRRVEPAHRPLLRARLRVAKEQYPEAGALDEKDDARVVRLEPPLGPRGPQHRDLPRPHLPAHAGAERLGTRVGGGAGQGRGIRAVAAGYVRRPHPPHRGHAGQTRHAAGVVGVCVREHEPSDAPDARTRERAPQRQRVGARVHEHRLRAVLHQDGVPLADVEHHQASRGCRGPASQKGNNARSGETDAYPPRASRPGPPHPQRGDTRGPSRDQPRTPRVARERDGSGTRHRCGQGCRHPGGRGRRAQQPAAHRRQHAIDRGSAQRERDRALDQRRQHKPGHRSGGRQHPEQACRQRRERPLHRRARRNDSSGAAPPSRQHRAHPVPGEPAEQAGAQARSHADPQRHIPGGGRIKDHQHDGGGSGAGQRMAPPTRRGRHETSPCHERRAHQRNAHAPREAEPRGREGADNGGPGTPEPERRRERGHESRGETEMDAGCGQQVRRTHDPERVLVHRVPAPEHRRADHACPRTRRTIEGREAPRPERCREPEGARPPPEHLDVPRRTAADLAVEERRAGVGIVGGRTGDPD